MSRIPRSAPRFRSTTLLTGGNPSLAGPAIVNSFNVLRDSPVKRQRVPGAGNLSHSGRTCSAIPAPATDDDGGDDRNDVVVPANPCVVA